MGGPKGFKLADWGFSPEDLGLLCTANINWSRPAEWNEDGKPPLGALEVNDALYAIVRDHWKQSNEETIVYVGMTTNLKARFNQHHFADELRKKRGTTKLSIGSVEFSGKKARWARQNTPKALSQIEHILIWALWPNLQNNKNWSSLPLIGGKGVADAVPWHIRQSGHRFKGRMPRELVYPWMAVKLGRDRSVKK